MPSDQRLARPAPSPHPPCRKTILRQSRRWWQRQLLQRTTARSSANLVRGSVIPCPSKGRHVAKTTATALSPGESLVVAARRFGAATDVGSAKRKTTCLEPTGCGDALTTGMLCLPRPVEVLRGQLGDGRGLDRLSLSQNSGPGYESVGGSLRSESGGIEAHHLIAIRRRSVAARATHYSRRSCLMRSPFAESSISVASLRCRVSSRLALVTQAVVCLR